MALGRKNLANATSIVSLLKCFNSLNNLKTVFIRRDFIVRILGPSYILWRCLQSSRDLNSLASRHEEFVGKSGRHTTGLLPKGALLFFSEGLNGDGQVKLADSANSRYSRGTDSKPRTPTCNPLFGLKGKSSVGEGGADGCPSRLITDQNSLFLYFHPSSGSKPTQSRPHPSAW